MGRCEIQKIYADVWPRSSIGTRVPSTPVTSIFKLIVRARPHLPAPFLSSTRALAIAPRFIFQDAINENPPRDTKCHAAALATSADETAVAISTSMARVYLQTSRPQFRKSSALSHANGSVGKKFRRDEMFIETSWAGDRAHIPLLSDLQVFRFRIVL